MTRVCNQICQKCKIWSDFVSFLYQFIAKLDLIDLLFSCLQIFLTNFCNVIKSHCINSYHGLEHYKGVPPPPNQGSTPRSKFWQYYMSWNLVIIVLLETLSNCQGQKNCILHCILYLNEVPTYTFAHWSNISCLPAGRINTNISLFAVVRTTN